MTNFKRFSIAAALSAAITTPAIAQQAVQEPGLQAFLFTRAWGSGQLQVGQRTRSHQLAASLYRWVRLLSSMRALSTMAIRSSGDAAGWATELRGDEGGGRAWRWSALIRFAAVPFASHWLYLVEEDRLFSLLW